MTTATATTAAPAVGDLIPVGRRQRVGRVTAVRDTGREYLVTVTLNGCEFDLYRSKCDVA